MTWKMTLVRPLISVIMNRKSVMSYTSYWMNGARLVGPNFPYPIPVLFLRSAMNGVSIPTGTKKNEMTLQKQLQAVLFDMDGVLLDSEEYICRAGIMMFKEKGYDLSPEDFTEFTGMGENRYLGGVAEKNGIPFELEKDKARTYDIYAEIVAGKLKPFDGVLEFIEKCRSRGLKLA